MTEWPFSFATYLGEGDDRSNYSLKEVEGEKKKNPWCGIELSKLRTMLFDIISICKTRASINYFLTKKVFNVFTHQPLRQDPISK